MNARQGKTMLHLWITKSEEEKIKEFRKYKSNLKNDDYNEELGEIMREAIKRGDLE
jgi:hypothetical protein